MKDLRKLIGEFRKARGLSYAEFSKRIFEGKVSPQTLKNLETGYVEPRISTLKTVSARLGLDLHEVAHQAFGLNSPEELGEINYSTKALIEIASDLDERRRQLLLTFARFLAWESKKSTESSLSTRSSHEISERADELSSISRKDHEYITEMLEELEREWKTALEEEENPFA